jgi:hypothetical protein
MAWAAAPILLDQKYTIAQYDSHGNLLWSVEMTVKDGAGYSAEDVYQSLVTLVAKAAFLSGVYSFTVSSATAYDNVPRTSGAHSEGRALDVSILNGTSVATLANTAAGQTHIQRFTDTFLRLAPTDARVLNPMGGWVKTASGNFRPIAGYFTTLHPGIRTFCPPEGCTYAQAHFDHIHFGWP